MDEVIEKAVYHLAKGDSIIYPTETLWALGCDATNEEAVKRINGIKRRKQDKGYVLLVDGIEMLSAYVGPINSTVRSIVSSKTPTTVVFSKHQLLPVSVLASDHTVAIRITQSVWCKKLLRAFGKPIVATSANFKDMPPATSYDELDKGLLDDVQFVINLEELEIMTKQPSRIVKLSLDGDIKTIR